jgi:hypothetical protein
MKPQVHELTFYLTCGQQVAVRLIEDSERERFDEELAAKHYLKNANAVG